MSYGIKVGSQNLPFTVPREKTKFGLSDGSKIVDLSNLWRVNYSRYVKSRTLRSMIEDDEDSNRLNYFVKLDDRTSFVWENITKETNSYGLYHSVPQNYSTGNGFHEIQITPAYDRPMGYGLRLAGEQNVQRQYDTLALGSTKQKLCFVHRNSFNGTITLPGVGNEFCRILDIFEWRSSKYDCSKIVITREGNDLKVRMNGSKLVEFISESREVRILELF